ncbi:SgcJ/EcaC family oxidoreductase [Labedaea rhizosphaerae]|uniref:Uncharacterized protein (TIGR02246 family) n=1 Tax=Labedaea rhizosphaerae TaxID=598644 RepID=A0A4R6RTM4_LABRH|nr:SgcJ/EcaC family oxidoreductase [Labedaea rhizosphaerae]TDP89366.1 uncharacterized protein (TIGR02246 family) [Labedaea rhizosphaerae]
MSDVQDIQTVFDGVYQAWADGDADAFAKLYTEDATVVMPGVFNQGRDAVRAHMAAGFAGPLAGSKGVDTPQDIRVIDGHTAIVVSEAGIIPAGQDEVPPGRTVRATWVLSKDDGQWLIAAYTNTPLG